MLKSSEISFTDKDFSFVAAMAAERYGIKIPDTKKGLLHARIAKRIRLLGLASMQDYMDRVSGTQGSMEQANFLTLLTTNTTSFFREEHHFEFLKKVVFPDHSLKSGNETMRIWSAGCSHGQEPYSISATLNAHRKTDRHFRGRIDATDVDKIVLDKARTGEYEKAEMTGLSQDHAAVLFGRNAGTTCRVVDDIRQNVDFNVLNLMDNFRFDQKFDVIFCRNVVIYFGRETQVGIWDKFLQYLKPGGYLFIGHSERLTGPASSKFENVGRTIYRLRSDNTQ